MPSKPQTTVSPCSRCGDPAGYIRHGYRLPARYDATPWGGGPGACHECFGLFMRASRASAASRPGFARGGAARFLPVKPCGRCGTKGGHTPANQSRPTRRDGSRYGLDPLCAACAATLRSRELRGTDVAAPPKPDNVARLRSGNDGWQGRAVEVRSASLDATRDAAPAPWSVGGVEGLRRAWDVGPWARLEASGLLVGLVGDREEGLRMEEASCLS